jgi:Flp pilus assembly protein TadG
MLCAIRRFLFECKRHADALRGAFDELRRAEAGNVALTFALAFIPLIGGVGAAVDYSNALKVRTWLQAAADAAAIGAISYSSAGLTAATTMTKDGPVSAGVTEGKDIFNGEISAKSGFTLKKLTVKVNRKNGSVTGSVTYSASVPTTFLGIFKIATITVTGSSSSSNVLPTYLDFYLLLDNTPSMGVGATPADVSTMVNHTSDQCAFACHDLNDPNNYYNLAKSLGVTMRIDVLRTATQTLMDTAKATEKYSNQFRMAIYTFGASSTTASLSTIQSLTSSLSTAKTAAANIDLMTVNGQGQFNDQDTNYDSILPAINSTISSPGDGTSSNSPQKVLFFVSDGVADEYNPASCSQPTTGGRCQQPMNLDLCTTIKKRGVKIAVLYTTYLPLPTNDWYNTWIAPFSGTISTNMQSCASPGLYFEVTPTGGISDAMNALFVKTVAEAHLTQ